MWGKVAGAGALAVSLHSRCLPTNWARIGVGVRAGGGDEEPGIAPPAGRRSYSSSFAASAPTLFVPEVVLLWLRVPGAESPRSRKYPAGGAPGPGSARSSRGAAGAPGSGLRHDQRAGHLRGEHDPHRRRRVSPLAGWLLGCVWGPSAERVRRGGCLGWERGRGQDSCPIGKWAEEVRDIWESDLGRPPPPGPVGSRSGA